MATSITIPEEVRERILAPIGYPVITESDLEVSFDFLDRIAIYPAMQKYFTYFPVQEQEFYSVSSQFEIPFPDTYVFGVADARIHPGYDFEGASPVNPFSAEKVINNRPFAHNEGMYGTRNDYGMSDVIPIVHAAKNARRALHKRFRIKVDESKRVVKGYTNTTGKLEVQWAYFSTNWADVKFVYETDVVNFASANIMEYFGRLRGQEESDLPVQFDAQEFLDAASTIKEEILGRWRAATKVSLIRK